MWQFLVSGYVPGTDLQITFDMIALFGASLLTTFMLWKLTIGRDLTYKRFLADMQNDGHDQTPPGNNSLLA